MSMSLQDAWNQEHKQRRKHYMEEQKLLASISQPDNTLLENKSSLDVQVGGAHYKGRAIQPVEYIHANNLNFFEGSAVKYITRWRNKGGNDDLRKAIHLLEMQIEFHDKDDTDVK